MRFWGLEVIMQAEDCIFCRIAEGTIPSAKVYEDENVVAFLDLSPVHPGHALVIPKAHYKDILEFPCGLAPAVCSAIQNVAKALMTVTGASGCNVLQNNGVIAGQSVFHVHWHVIPRFDGDGLELWRQGSYADDGAMQEMAEKMARAIKG